MAMVLSEAEFVRPSRKSAIAEPAPAPGVRAVNWPLKLNAPRAALLELVRFLRKRISPPSLSV
ncbi:MAG: hypothetical protein JMDDDDMK_04899 [Acidobacteria bacterium]|nr:hypothetical protein [Acidobacteriota bacterium]